MDRWSAAGGRGQVLVSYVQALGPAASNECGLLTVKVIAYTPLHHLCSDKSVPRSVFTITEKAQFHVYLPWGQRLFSIVS